MVVPGILSVRLAAKAARMSSRWPVPDTATAQYPVPNVPRSNLISNEALPQTDEACSGSDRRFMTSSGINQSHWDRSTA
jgi:hypothetical protein